MKNQLSVVDDIVCRSLKLVSSDVQVPVLPSSLQSQGVAAIHRRTGHTGRDTMWQALREECFFPGMADACRKFVYECTACQEANPRSSERPQPTRPVSPGRP